MDNNTVAVYLTIAVILVIYFLVYGTLRKLLEEIKELLTKFDDTHVDTKIDESHRLNLCIKHKQEDNQSHYSEHNCHYCQLKIKLTHQQRPPGPE